MAVGKERALRVLQDVVHVGLADLHTGDGLTDLVHLPAQLLATLRLVTVHRLHARHDADDDEQEQHERDERGVYELLERQVGKEDSRMYAYRDQYDTADEQQTDEDVRIVRQQLLYGQLRVAEDYSLPVLRRIDEMRIAVRDILVIRYLPPRLKTQRIVVVAITLCKPVVVILCIRVALVLADVEDVPLVHQQRRIAELLCRRTQVYLHVKQRDLVVLGGVVELPEIAREAVVVLQTVEVRGKDALPPYPIDDVVEVFDAAIALACAHLLEAAVGIHAAQSLEIVAREVTVEIPLTEICVELRLRYALVPDGLAYRPVALHRLAYPAEKLFRRRVVLAKHLK